MGKRGKKGKKKLKLSASGVFAAAEAEALQEEKALIEQRKREEEEERERQKATPQLLPKDNEIAAATAEQRNKTRYGRPIYQNRQAATPILRVGRKPGLGGRSLPAFLTGGKDSNASANLASNPGAPLQQVTAAELKPVLQVKKSKLKLEQERKEAKRKQGEEEAKKLLAEFENSFNAAPSAPVVEPPLKSKGKKKGGSALDAMLVEMKQRQAGGKKPPMDSYDSLERSGSYNYGDDATTNIYVGNLATSVTEEILLREFGQFGPLVSVKIMWPKNDQQRTRPVNCGFVAFRTRDSAEAAMKALNNEKLHTSALRLDWGKPVKDIASLSTLTASSFSKSTSSVKTHSIDPEMLRQRPLCFDPFPPSGGVKVQVTQPEWQKNRWLVILINRTAEYIAADGNAFELMLRKREQQNPEYSWLYDRSAENLYFRWRVIAYLMGGDNITWALEPFRFYANDDTWFIPPPLPCEEQKHYYVTAQECQRMRKEMKTKVNPEDNKFLTGAAKERKHYSARLRKREKKNLRRLLDNMTLERESVLDVMGFCLDFAECASECSAILVESLIGESSETTPALLIIARLYALSDILHNSNAPVKNASAYRTELQPKLPAIFEVLGEMYRTSGGRFSAELVKTRVCKVLNAWRSWMLLSPKFVLGLEITFLNELSDIGENEKTLVKKDFEPLDMNQLIVKCSQNGICSDGKSKEVLIEKLTVVEAIAKRKEMENQMESQAKEERRRDEEIKQKGPQKKIDMLLEEKLKEVEVTNKNKNGGAAGDDVGSDIDGEPMDSDLDGEPMDSDLDGEPMDEYE